MLDESWDDWLGMLALEGVDPRTWDLNQLLSAYETALRKSAKDETAWRRTHAQLYAEPPEERARRRRGARQEVAGRMTVDDAEAMLARFAAQEAQYG